MVWLRLTGILPREHLTVGTGAHYWKLPGREALARHCAAIFQNAFTAETEAAALALLDCDQEGARTNQYVLTKYVLPAIGLLLMVLGLVDYFG